MPNNFEIKTLFQFEYALHSTRHEKKIGRIQWNFKNRIAGFSIICVQQIGKFSIIFFAQQTTGFIFKLADNLLIEA